MHLLVNASLLESAGTYQRSIYQIHSFGRLLPLIEWTFIFAPILFHGLLGLVIIAGGMANTAQYPYSSNVRYMLQRATGMIALLFIAWHVFQMHGWFHFEAWREHVALPLGGAEFRPFNAASSVAEALHGVVIPSLYAIGILACVYHLANGIWTMGITWGVWISPEAQRRANWLAGGVGAILSVVGISALIAATQVDIPQALRTEDAMYRAMTEARLILPTPEKRSDQGAHEKQ